VTFADQYVSGHDSYATDGNRDLIIDAHRDRTDAGVSSLMKH
jgi:hypothetical protein